MVGLVVTALIFSAVLLLFAAAYFVAQAQRDAERRGIYDKRVNYMAGMMAFVGIVEIGAAAYLLMRVGTSGGGGGAGTGASRGGRASRSDEY